MKLHFDSESKLKLNKFSKLGAWYIMALCVIATVAILGQFLIQRHLQSQSTDSRVVNLAGTQRYKSQWIVKMSLLLYYEVDHKHFPDKVKTLEKLLAEWKKGHLGLQFGDADLHLPGKNSPRITAMFKDVDPYFDRIYASANQIIDYKRGMISDQKVIDVALHNLLDAETIFLRKMDDIVFQYDAEARSKVNTLSKLEYFLLALSIIVILLEIIFVFRPTTTQVNRTVNELIASENNAKKLSKEIGELYASLERSYEQLSQVNEPVETPRIYAKADHGGNITFISPLFFDLAGQLAVEKIKRICDLFKGSGLGDDWMDEVVETVSEGKMWHGEIKYDSQNGEQRCADIIINPVFNNNEVEELLILGSDITQRKYAERHMVIKNKAQIEKKINQQKFRSVLILEGQEEERKRLAMDIHDGIGQMLTSLKYQVESINASNEDESARKLSEIKQLTGQIIKEVRRVTFNLKPTVLGDYGIQAALNVFVKEISKLTDIKLNYQVTGEMSTRLPQQVENNIFRIVQEAINNALKYSETDSIEILFKHNPEDIQVVVKDNGKGFDEKILQKRSMNIESGRGFFNMFERSEYINAQLDIKSAPGKGTTVILTVPLHNTVLIEN